MARKSDPTVQHPRLDELLLERSLAENLREARALILRGKVSVDGRIVDKAGYRIPRCQSVCVRPLVKRSVSRGTEKVLPVLEAWGLSMKGTIWSDVGAGTGGFTEALLCLGVSRVYALDVGKGVLHGRLREDPRVICMEGLNARYLRRDSLPEACDGAMVDVSFISLLTVMGGVLSLLKAKGVVIPLIKPQFEAPRQSVEPGGIVTRKDVLIDVLTTVLQGLKERHGLNVRRLAPAALSGAKGNQEFLALLTRHGPEPGIQPEDAVTAAVERVI